MSSPFLHNTDPANSPVVEAEPGVSATLLNAPEFCRSPEDEEFRLAQLAITLNAILINTEKEINFAGQVAEARESLKETIHDPSDLEQAVQQKMLENSRYKEKMDERANLKNYAKELMQGIRPEESLAMLTQSIETAKRHEETSRDMLHSSGTALQTSELTAIKSRAATLTPNYDLELSRTSALDQLQEGSDRRQHEASYRRVRTYTGSGRVLEELHDEVFVARQETISNADKLVGDLKTVLQKWDIRDTRSVDPGSGTSIRKYYNELVEILNKGNLLQVDGERVRLFEESTRLLVRLEERGILQDSLPSNAHNKLHKHAGYTQEGGVMLHEDSEREYIVFADGTVGKQDDQGNLHCVNANGQPVDARKGVVMPEPTREMADGEPHNHDRLNTLFKTWEENRTPEDAIALHTFLEERINYQNHLGSRLTEANEAYVQAGNDLSAAQYAPAANTHDERLQRDRKIAAARTQFQQALDRREAVMSDILHQEGGEDQLRANLNKNVYWQLRLEVGNLSDVREENVEIFPDGAIELEPEFTINGIEVEEWKSILWPTGESELLQTDGRRAHYSATGRLMRYT